MNKQIIAGRLHQTVWAARASTKNGIIDSLAGERRLATNDALATDEIRIGLFMLGLHFEIVRNGRLAHACSLERTLRTLQPARCQRGRMCE